MRAMKDLYQEEIIDPGDRASKLAKDLCFLSHTNCPAVVIIPHQTRNFRGPVGFVWRTELLAEMASYGYNVDDVFEWQLAQEVENDGAGGKPQFFTLIGTPEVMRGLGWEIIAMTADDFARSGRFPAIIDNEANAKRITNENFHLFKAMMEGYVEALKKTRLVNITGEVAIMKHSITAFCDTNSAQQLVLTWGASCIGLARKRQLITGENIKPNMPIVGFWEPGYRCNGGTFFTNLILEKWGAKIQDVLQNDHAREFVKKLTVPSQCYSPTITRLVGWGADGSYREPLARIYGIAHITGGGVWGKLKDILPRGVGAVLNTMPKPADVLLEAQELSIGTSDVLTDFRAYGTLHGGCGMLAICHKLDADKIIREAARDGHVVYQVGTTVPSDENRIEIHSRFMEKRILCDT